MFRAIAKCFGLFIFAYVIFSIPVENKSLFTHLSKVINPLAKKAVGMIGENAKESFGKTQKLGQKLFSNSEPRPSLNAEDKKPSAQAQHTNDDIRDEERAALNRLIGN